MKFIDSVLLTASSKTIKVPPGSYENFNLRFSGTQSGATAPTEADFGAIDIYYRGTSRAHILMSELGVYDLKKGGTREATASAGDTQPFAYNYIWFNAHPDDKNNILYVKDDTECYIVWTPLSTLAARVSAASQLRVTAPEKLGTMNYFYGWKRVDVSMVAGETTPQDILPFGVSAVYIEYNTNIDNLDLTVDGALDQQSAEVVEILNQDLHRNKVETYATTGAGSFAEIDLMKSKNPLESLQNSIKLILRGSSADTISVFWQYFDYTPTAQQISAAAYAVKVQNAISLKTVSGGNSAVQIVTKIPSNPFGMGGPAGPMSR